MSGALKITGVDSSNNGIDIEPPSGNPSISFSHPTGGILKLRYDKNLHPDGTHWITFSDGNNSLGEGVAFGYDNSDILPLQSSGDIGKSSDPFRDLFLSGTAKINGNTVSPDTNSNAHHSRYSDEEAQDAVGNIVGNALSYNDSGNSIDVSEGNISHDNISGVSSADHHSKTSSASELSDVSPDSTSNAHHSRYSDEEAVSSITDSRIRPEQSIHSRSIDSEINLSADEGLVLSGPVTGTSKITGSGTFSVSGGVDFNATDAIEAINNDNNHGSTASHNYFSGSHTALSDISSDDHHSKTSSASELSDVSPDSNNNAHHDKYTDFEAVDAVESESTINVDISGDANTVGSRSAEEISGVISTFVATGVSEGNINDGRDIDWSSQDTNTGSYVFDGRRITVQENGVYEIRSDIDFESSNQSRANPNIFIQKNGSTVGVGGASGYMRDAEGHDNASIHASFIGSLSVDDTIKVTTSRGADNGTVSPVRGHIYIKQIE